MVMWKNVLILRRCILNYFEMKCHVCNFFGQKKKECQLLNLQGSYIGVYG